MSSHLQATLNDGKFALTAEVTPPLSADPGDLLAKALPLRGLADAVNVTDGASARAHLDSVVAAALLVQNGIEPILQLTCRDRNRIALQSALVGAAALGVKNVLVLTGDDPKAGDQPDAKPVFDLDSRTLIRTAITMRDKGELLHGRKIGGRLDFFVGAADAPIDPPPGWAPNSLKGKVDSGAQFAQTQFCMDTGIVRRYIDRLRENGIPADFRLLIGVAPLASARSANWIRQNLFGSIIPDTIVARLEAATDAKAEGVRICVETIRALQGIDGVSGVHIMAPLNESAIPEVIRQVRAG